jgi:hypothetical protein
MRRASWKSLWAPGKCSINIPKYSLWVSTAMEECTVRVPLEGLTGKGFTKLGF